MQSRFYMNNTRLNRLSCKMLSTKFVCVLVYSIVQVALGFEYSADLQVKFVEVHDKCKAESGASEESIRSSAHGGEFAEDYEYKCYLKCTMVEFGTMNGDGEVDVDAAVSALPQEMLDSGIDHLIKTCGTKKGADDCETAWLTLKCYQQEGPEVFISI